MSSKQKSNPSADKKASPVASSQPQQRAATSTEVTPEQIAQRAYELFLARGGIHGRHEEDWQQAERELRLGRQ
jgi:hypothetical protein